MSSTLPAVLVQALERVSHPAVMTGHRAVLIDRAVDGVHSALQAAQGTPRALGHDRLRIDGHGAQGELEGGPFGRAAPGVAARHERLPCVNAETQARTIRSAAFQFTARKTLESVLPGT